MLGIALTHKLTHCPHSYAMSPGIWSPCNACDASICNGPFVQALPRLMHVAMIGMSSSVKSNTNNMKRYQKCGHSLLYDIDAASQPNGELGQESST